MILVIDNYDSFTYNLVQYLGELGCDLLVKRNDTVTVDDVRVMLPVTSSFHLDPAHLKTGDIAGSYPYIPQNYSHPGCVPGTPVHRQCFWRCGGACSAFDARQNQPGLPQWSCGV